MKIKIPNAEVQQLLSSKVYYYPKYTTQILNLANQNAQGTRPKIVGQMSDLIQQFQGTALDEWEKWYLAGNPNAIDNATNKIYEMVQALKVSIEKIDKEMVRTWVEEFLIVKTFSGLKFQAAILQRVGAYFNKPNQLATPEEESKGIDGFIGGKPVSIKPNTYKIKKQLKEFIQIPIIYYEKNKNEIIVEFDPDDF